LKSEPFHCVFNKGSLKFHILKKLIFLFRPRRGKMKKKGCLVILAMLLVIPSTSGAITSERFLLNLNHDEKAALPKLDLQLETPMDDSTPAAEARTMKKRPWLAALETVGINLSVWAVDRYALKKDFAYISWTTIKNNFKKGLVFCADPFSTSFLGHPYHGSAYFNTARSLGLTFWESIPYAIGGYLTWGFFLENDYASINDLVMTSAGGVQLGELFFRLSSQVLHGGSGGKGQAWREIAAFLIDPVRGFNRLILGGAERQNDANRQAREPLSGHLGLVGKFLTQQSSLSGLKAGGGLDLDFIYGVDGAGISAGNPFDLIVFNGGFRYANPKTYLNFSTYALWLGTQFGNGAGQNHVFGLFQELDYLNNEIMRVAGTSFSAGIFSRFPLGGRFELKTAAQLGFMPMAGDDNPYTLIGPRDYNYSMGGAARLDAWLSRPGLGTLYFTLGHHHLFTLKNASKASDKSRDFITQYGLRYDLPLGKCIGLRLGYDWIGRRQYFESHPTLVKHLAQISAGIVLNL
jgi:hypothetical protein